MDSTLINIECIDEIADAAGRKAEVAAITEAAMMTAMMISSTSTGGAVGGTGKDLDGKLPEKIQWIAHNYNHLHEAPTVFYAVALALALIGTMLFFLSLARFRKTIGQMA